MAGFALTAWKSTVKRDHAQKYSWNQLFSNFFSKYIITLIWRKNVDFSVKIVIAFLVLFHIVVCSLQVVESPKNGFT